MKIFTGFLNRIKEHPRISFVLWVLAFYLVMLGIYLYLMNANLSTAPQFIYSQF